MSRLNPPSGRTVMNVLFASLRAQTEQGRCSANERLMALVEQNLEPGAVDWVVELATVTLGIVVARNPHRRVDRHAVQCLNEELGLVMLLELVGTAVPVECFDPNRPHTVVRDLVADEVPLDRVIANIRAVQQHWIDAARSHARDRAVTDEIEQKVVIIVTRVMNRFLDAQIRLYLTEQQRVALSAPGRRSRLIGNLVRGRFADPVLVRELLALDLDDRHVAAVLSTDDLSPRGLDALQIAVARFAGGLTDRVLVHEPAQGTIWMWASGTRGPTAARTVLLDGDAVRGGVGSARSGRDGFRRSHREAVAAARVAHGDHFVPYADVALASLLCRDPERAGWFARQHLGTLAEPGPAAHELRATLQVYYRSQMRLVTAAQQLGLHRNTLISRLRRIEEALGRPVTDRLAEVMCALLVLDLAADLAHGDGSPTPAMPRPTTSPQRAATS